MKKQSLLNAEIIREIAALGHTEYFCIADCGLPIPKQTKVIDISVVSGIPSFLDVLDAVCSELVVESIILAQEINTANPQLAESVRTCVGHLPKEMVSHEEFKEKTTKAKCIIRTGEASPYANILLVGGVNF